MIEQMETDQHASRRNAIVLIAVPAKGVSELLFIGQSESAAIGCPKSEAFPSTRVKALKESGDGKLEEVAEETGQEFLSGLNESAFGDGNLTGAEPIEKLVKFNRQGGFEECDVEPYDTLQEEGASSSEVTARPAKVMLRVL